jgi:hypothetical protein
VDANTAYLQQHAGLELHYTTTRTDYSYTPAIYRIANFAAAVNVAAHAVNDGAPDMLVFGGVSEGIAPAGDALFTTSDDKDTIICCNCVDDRGNKICHGRCVSLGPTFIVLA